MPTYISLQFVLAGVLAILGCVLRAIEKQKIVQKKSPNPTITVVNGQVNIPPEITYLPPSFRQWLNQTAEEQRKYSDKISQQP